MQLIAVVETSQQVASSPSRLKKTEVLANCLRSLEPGEIETAVAFLTGQLRQGKIGVGWAAIQEALAEPSAANPTLTLTQVHQCFQEIAETSGAGSTAKRKELLGRLFTQATPREQNFLARLLIGELRQGALEAQMAEAIAKAAKLPPAQVRRALMLTGDAPAVAHRALTEGAAGLSRFSIRLFRPIQPMLAQPVEAVADALERLGSGAFEYKMDGARIQVHKGGGEVRVFTRRLNEVTAAVPEVVEAALRLPVEEIILDGEAVALRPDGRPYPFQTTMRRFGRKLDVEKMRETLPIRPYFFDCLHLDGAPQIDLPGAARFAALREALPDGLLTPRIETADPEEAQSFLDQALSEGQEGVMAKSLEAVYDAGRRGASWLKIKPSHTLDLVVLAAEWGHGRRRGFLSNLHLGARDPQSGQFVMLGKTFKGLTDHMLAWQTKKLQELETERAGHVVYVRPELVVEVAFNEIQSSPRYPAGMALRFARVKRYRPDKSAKEADSVEVVRTIFEGSGGR